MTVPAIDPTRSPPRQRLAYRLVEVEVEVEVQIQRLRDARVDRSGWSVPRTLVALHSGIFCPISGD